MEITYHIAETEEEREQIYRLRYEVYVEEMHIFGSVADHDRKMLKGPNDEHARLLYAKHGDELVASMRLNLGKDAPFSEELEETYNLSRFSPAIDASQILVITRFMVKKAFRGSQISFRMIELVAELGKAEGLEVAVCDCQPHLIRYYQRMGFRSYDCKVYNDPEFGIMVPLAFAVRDLKYLDEIHSPLKKILGQLIDDHEKVAHVVSMFGKPAVNAVDGIAAAEKEWVLNCLSNGNAPLFEGISSAEIDAIISHGYLLTLNKKDLVIRKSQQTSTVFVVLSGELDICKEGQRVCRVGSGEITGELGFLLETRRTADVYVASDQAVLLSLDESRLKKRIKSRSTNATQLLFNLCQILASRVSNRLESVPLPEIKSFMVAA